MPDIDSKLMSRALELAQSGDPSPNPHVGAVIADGEEIIAEDQRNLDLVRAKFDAGKAAWADVLTTESQLANDQGRPRAPGARSLEPIAACPQDLAVVRPRRNHARCDPEQEGGRDRGAQRKRQHPTIDHDARDACHADWYERAQDVATRPRDSQAEDRAHNSQDPALRQ